jgi:hypothetical protein
MTVVALQHPEQQAAHAWPLLLSRGLRGAIDGTVSVMLAIAVFDRAEAQLRLEA